MNPSTESLGWFYMRYSLGTPMNYSHHRTLEGAVRRYIVDFNLGVSVEQVVAMIETKGKLVHRVGDPYEDEAIIEAIVLKD